MSPLSDCYFTQFLEECLTPAEGTVGLAFADGELLSVARAGEFRIGAGILGRTTRFRGVDAAYGTGAEEPGSTLTVPAPNIRAFLLFRNTSPLDVRRRGRLIVRKHRDHVLTAVFVFTAHNAVVPTARIRTQDGERDGEEQAHDEECLFHDHSGTSPEIRDPQEKSRLRDYETTRCKNTSNLQAILDRPNVGFVSNFWVCLAPRSLVASASRSLTFSRRFWSGGGRR